MRVRIKESMDVDMTTLPREAYGQVTIRFDKTGKAVYHFRAGATPELPGALANEFLQSGIAEPFIGEPVEVKTVEELLDGAKR